MSQIHHTHRPLTCLCDCVDPATLPVPPDCWASHDRDDRFEVL